MLSLTGTVPYRTVGVDSNEKIISGTVLVRYNVTVRIRSFDIPYRTVPLKKNRRKKASDSSGVSINMKPFDGTSINI